MIAMVCSYSHMTASIIFATSRLTEFDILYNLNQSKFKQSNVTWSVCVEQQNVMLSVVL